MPARQRIAIADESTPESQEAVFALLADPATHGGARGQAHRHPCGVGLPGRRARARRSSARCASRSSTIRRSTSARPPARPSSRSTAVSRPTSTAASSPITREADGRLALDGRGEPVEWAVEMRRFDEDATLDHLAAAGTIDAALADALGRTVAAAHARRRRRPTPRAGSRRWRSYIDEHVDGLRPSTPELFPADANRCARARPSRAAFARIRPLLVERGRHGLHPPHPRRPASRQYRAARRPAGAVRRHRVQRADRVRRRALRSRLPADGPGRARPRAGGEHRAQPLPRRSRGATRTSTRSRRCRSSCRCGRRSAPR